MIAALETTPLTVEIAPGARLHCQALTLQEGERLGIYGSNGAGKTSLLRALSGELRLSSGELRLRGRNITELGVAARVRAGLRRLPQTSHVFPHLTTSENFQVAAASAALHHRALEEFEAALPEIPPKVPAGVLSGGEQQLLALLMTLSGAAHVYLLDEPFAALDPSRVSLARDLLKDTLVQQQAAAIIIDHERSRLKADCNRYCDFQEIARLEFG